MRAVNCNIEKTEYFAKTEFRGVAQLVARLVRDQEAMGSNPVTSTTAGDFACKSQQKEDCFTSSFFVASLLLVALCSRDGQTK